MMDGLVDPRAKVQRARQHWAELQAGAAEWLGEIGVTLEPDPHSEWYLFRLREQAPRPPLGLVMGDLVNNLKGALDILVWQLVLAAGDKPRNSTAFPVVTGEGQWAKEADRRLKGVADAWVSMIEQLQPYHADDPQQHPLAILNRTNNRSKHQVIASTALSGLEWKPEFAVRVPGPASGPPPEVRHELEVTWPPGKNLVDGEVVGRVRFDPPVTAAKVVAMPAHLSMGFVIDPPVRGDWPDLIGHVDGVLDLFAKAF